VGGAHALVTGGAGTIGSHVVDGLLAGGARSVVVLDDLSRGRPENLEAALASGRVELVKGDVCDREMVRHLTVGADVVFHLAAMRITQCADEPRRANEVLVEGTLNVIEAATAAKVGKLVASSSASVYGQAEIFPTPEDHHPYRNDTLYGAAKAYNEAMLRSYHAMYGLNYVALRYFNVYGPRMDARGRYTEVLVRWIERIEAGDPPIIFGDGKQTMDFVHVTDIARANLRAAESEATDRVFNVASGVETSLLELANKLLAAMGARLTPEHQPARGVNAVTRRLGDTTAARRELGFTPEIDLGTGLIGLVEWWRAQGRSPAGRYNA
jgi:UDP-glucose 4-epimerase